MKKIVTTEAPAAIGPYSQGMVFGDMVFSSGQIPVIPATGEVAGATIAEQAEQSCKNVGKAVDVNNALDGEGPFSPERAGTLPAGQLIDLCCSGRYTKDELKKRISGRAGLTAHLGTTDVPAIVRRIEEGDKHAGLVLDAMIYQIAKSIGAASVVLYGKIDAILLTGGMAHSDYIISRLKERISFLAPVHVYPGEDEMEALALNALGALRGELPIQEYK